MRNYTCQMMRSLSLTFQKLWRSLKLTANRQTHRETDRHAGQKQYAPIMRSKCIKYPCSAIILRVFTQSFSNLSDVLTFTHNLSLNISQSKVQSQKEAKKISTNLHFSTIIFQT